MIHLDDIKAFVHNDRSDKVEIILTVITTLISGLIIIISISPEYLRELNPFTLFILSIASALPVWALNQLFWWHLGRRECQFKIKKLRQENNCKTGEKKIKPKLGRKLKSGLIVLR